MANLKTFSHFPKLPPETRRRIWQQALSIPELWVVRQKDYEFDFELYQDCHHVEGEEVRWPPDLPPTMTFLGPAHYLLGHSCREARQIMEESYMQFDSVRGGVVSPWFTVEKTVEFVSDGFDMTTALAAFGVDEVARFKHLGWGGTARFYPVPSIQLREHIEMCNKRRENNRDLGRKTLIIGRMGDVEKHYYARCVERDALWKYLHGGNARLEDVPRRQYPRPVGYSCFGESWAWFCKSL